MTEHATTQGTHGARNRHDAPQASNLGRRSTVPAQPRRTRPVRRHWRDSAVRVVETLPLQGALTTMAAVLALTIPAAPKGSWAPGAQGVAAFVTVVTVRPAAQAGVRTVRRQMLRRGWHRG